MADEKKTPEGAAPAAKAKPAAAEVKPDLERVEPEVVKKGKAAKGEAEGKLPKEKKQKAKKSIATCKLRQGQKIGCMVPLRRERMYEFFDRFVNLALPRVRDFKGISPKSFDGRGNFSVGIKEQIIFPEVDYDKIDKIKGLNVTIGTTARTDDEGRALLKHLGMPFRS